MATAASASACSAASFQQAPVAACASAHSSFGAPSAFGGSAAFGRSAPKTKRGAKPKRGVANAARVSKGSVVDSWGGLTVHAPERHQSEHVTVTVVIYNTVVGGVPTVADVAAAIDDLERLYAGCSAAGKLAEPTFDFMKHGMAGSGASHQVAQKVALQPYTHTAGVVQNPAVFPTDSAPPNYFLQTPPPQQHHQGCGGLWGAVPAVPKCATGHPMPISTFGSELGNATAYVNGWTCDNTACTGGGATHHPTVGRHFCQQCGVDLCSACGHQIGQQQQQQQQHAVSTTK